MGEQEAIAYLRSTQGIRERCGQLFELGLKDELTHFRVDLQPLERVADYVIDVMRSAYPDLQVPFHSRWRHFEVGHLNQKRLALLDQRLAPLSPLEKARAKFDLVIPSVLLDAGAGAHWSYQEALTGQVFSRSEGLGVASFHLFLAGVFSSDPTRPLQADAAGLGNVTEAMIREGFQVSDQNPLVGVAGRSQLLQRLGEVLSRSPHLFSCDSINRDSINSDSINSDHIDEFRLGYLVDYLITQARSQELEAQQVFQAVLEGLSEIWAGRISLGGVNLGDVWRHSALPNDGIGAQLVPFHKLSQWLTYSLLEPLQELGLKITHLDQLTGLSEYRNGGLCVDLGLLQPKHEGVFKDIHSPDSEVIVEWRSLTVILLDQIAAAIRQKMGLDETTLPLAKVLEGGTWAAGRKIAAGLRDGSPPIQILSDGTVF
jgi:hypothetical protein